MKKIIFGCCMIICISLFVGCTNTITITSTNDDKQKVTNEIFESYLKQYTDESTSEKSRITEYTITSSEVLSEKDSSWEAKVNFEIKPYSWDNYYLKGNGKYVEGDKKILRYAYVNISKDSNTYKLKKVDFNKGLGK